MAMLGLHCCADFSLVAVYRLLTAVASPVAVQSLGRTVFSSYNMWAQQPEFAGSKHRLHTCGTRASLLHGTEDLPRSGIKPVSCIAAGFFTTEPPEKPFKGL